MSPVLGGLLAAIWVTLGIISYNLIAAVEVLRDISRKLDREVTKS